MKLNLNKQTGLIEYNGEVIPDDDIAYVVKAQKAFRESNKTVEEKYDFDEDELEERADEKEYWVKALSFYREVKFKKIKDLTPAQINWLDSINISL